MNARRGRSGLQGVFERIGVWSRSPRNPAEHHELSSRDLGRLDRVFKRLTDTTELSGRRRLAAELVTLWAEDVPPARANLLRALAEGALPDDAQRVALGVLGSSSPEVGAPARQRLELLADAQRAVRTRADAILDELGAAPGGVRFLVELRAAAIDVAARDDDAAASALDLLVQARLQVLMTPALIELRRLDWDTPASLLQRVAALEKVHPIESIDQLRSRLADDRAAFALFHPGMHGEPLAFVWLAFTKGIPDSLDRIIGPHAGTVPVDRADTAVFWSISSPQPGLAGMGFGNELIKATVNELRTTHPTVSTYVTLSPVPSFAQHVLATISGDEDHEEFSGAGAAPPEGVAGAGAIDQPPRTMLGTLGMNRPADEVQRLLSDDIWMVSDEAARYGGRFLKLAAEYLTDTDTDTGGRSPDPVANFHLGNGAQLARLCWGANRTHDGVARSLTLMANYLYEPDRLSERAGHYRTEGQVSVGDDVARLLDEASD